MRLQGCPQTPPAEASGGSPNPIGCGARDPLAPAAPSHRVGGISWQQAQTPLHKQPRHKQHRPPSINKKAQPGPKIPLQGPKIPPWCWQRHPGWRTRPELAAMGARGPCSLSPDPAAPQGGQHPTFQASKRPSPAAARTTSTSAPITTAPASPPVQGHLGSCCHQQHSPIWGQGGQQDFGTPSPKGCSRAGKMFSCAGRSDGCSGTQLLPAVLRGRWLLSRARSFSLHSAKFMAGKWAPISFLILGWGGK